MQLLPSIALLLVSAMAISTIAAKSLETAKRNELLSLLSGRYLPAQSLNTDCTEDSTVCGSDKCCKFKEGVCCDDGEHCCANGYRCDGSNKRCVKNVDRIDSVKGIPETSGIKYFEPFKTVQKNSKVAQSCCLTFLFHWLCCDDLCTPLGCI